MGENEKKYLQFLTLEGMQGLPYSEAVGEPWFRAWRYPLIH